MTVSTKHGINIEYDSETGDYFIIWEPLVIAGGKTKTKVLEELRAAAHYGVDTIIDVKLKDTIKED